MVFLLFWLLQTLSVSQSSWFSSSWMVSPSSHYNEWSLSLEVCAILEVYISTIIVLHLCSATVLLGSLPAIQNMHGMVYDNMQSSGSCVSLPRFVFVCCSMLIVIWILLAFLIFSLFWDFHFLVSPNMYDGTLVQFCLMLFLKVLFSNYWWVTNFLGEGGRR
jgi:hypothetical protein